MQNTGFVIEKTEQDHYVELLLREIILERIIDVMGWTREKATLWYMSPHTSFSNVSPEILVALNHGYRVVSYLEDRFLEQ